MGASPDHACVLPANMAAASEPSQVCAWLVRELSGRVTVASAMSPADRTLTRRSAGNDHERMQLPSPRSETGRLLNSLEKLLVDAREPAAGSHRQHGSLLSLSALSERLSASMPAQLGFPSGLALEFREPLSIQVSGNEAVIEQVLVHLVRAIQTNQGGSIGIKAYSDPRQAGKSDLCFEVTSRREAAVHFQTAGCRNFASSLPACPDRELECARALALAIGAEVTAPECVRQRDTSALHLRIPMCVFVNDEKPLRLLLVDDRRINQMVLADDFSSFGHLVAVAGNATNALEMLRNQAFDAVLTDLNMPCMNGLELTAAIRELRDPASKLPVILLVPEESPVIFEKAQTAGASAIARKHAGPEHILSVLASHLPSDGSRWGYVHSVESSLTVH